LYIYTNNPGSVGGRDPQILGWGREVQWVVDGSWILYITIGLRYHAL